jgi:4-amino-4-deoxy-L-arabinose transferase-like glycosyltransferase
VTRSAKNLWIGAAAVTVIALAVRIPGLSQSLFGDELFTYDTASVGSVHDLFHAIRTTEVSPPLFFVVEWLVRRVSDAQVWLRLPSLVCGVALIPVVYAVGRRLVGPPAALVGAGLAALSPFLVWYSDEARGYALLALLVVGSTWALLVALEQGGLWRWALVTVLVAAALLTHYTALFVLIAQVLWACVVRRDRLVPVLASFAVAALIVAVWLPFAPADNGAIAFLVHLTPSTVGREGLRAVAGQPYAKVSELPGTAAFVCLALAGLAAVAGAVVAVRSGRADRRLALVALLAVATPLGVIAYSLFQPNIYVGRNLISSVPYLYLLVGALLVALPRPLAVAGVLLAAAGLGIGLAKSFEQRYQRPDWKGVAAYLNRNVVNGDRVVELELFPVPSAPGRGPVNLRALQVGLSPSIRSLSVPGADPRRLAAAGAGHRVIWVADQQVGGLFFAPPPPRIGGGYVLAGRRVFDGLAQIAVYRFERR